MRSLGLDVGTRRIGVALSDPQGILAIPLTVIDNLDETAAIEKILNFVWQYEVECIVVGLPYSLNGSLGPQADKVVAFTERLRHVSCERVQPSHRGTIDIQLWDERLSTVAAEKLLIEANAKKDKRSQYRDAIAAAFILQGFLDSCRCEQGEESG